MISRRKENFSQLRSLSSNGVESPILVALCSIRTAARTQPTKWSRLNLKGAINHPFPDPQCKITLEPVHQRPARKISGTCFKFNLKKLMKMVSTNNPKVTEGTTPDERDTNNPPGDESVSENAQPVVPVGPQLSVRVFKTFPGAEKASPEAVCKVGSAATFENESLGYLRKYLNNQKILKSIE